MCKEIVISDIPQLNELIISFDNKSYDSHNETWIFRGIKKSSYELLTTFDRAVINLNEIEHTLKKTNFELEKDIIKKFMRQGRNYIDQKSNGNDWLETIALMQHHGAPTRLMDWSYSFYVALFFAFEDAEKAKRIPDDDPVVYACDCSELNRRVRELFNSKADENYKVVNSLLYDLKNYENYEKYQVAFKGLIIKDYEIPYVYAINPYFLNQRLTVQQGLFLFQGDISKSFIENHKKINVPFKKFVIKYELKRDIMCMLHRMNINYISLFPGLDGFSKSLRDLHNINYQT